MNSWLKPIEIGVQNIELKSKSKSKSKPKPKPNKVTGKSSEPIIATGEACALDGSKCRPKAGAVERASYPSWVVYMWSVLFWADFDICIVSTLV